MGTRASQPRPGRGQTCEGKLFEVCTLPPAPVRMAASSTCVWTWILSHVLCISLRFKHILLLICVLGQGAGSGTRSMLLAAEKVRCLLGVGDGWVGGVGAPGGECSPGRQLGRCSVQLGRRGVQALGLI